MSVGLVAVALFTSATLELDWTAPDACPTQEVVRARLGSVNGHVTAVITERASGWHLQLRVDDTVRELTSRSCEDATEAAVLIVHLALTRPPSTEHRSPVRADAEAARPWTVHLSLAAGLNAGFLPRVLARVGVSLSLEWTSLVLLLNLSTALPQRYEGGPTASAAVIVHQLVHAQAGACWAFSIRALRLGPCLSGGAAALLIQGVNVTEPKSTVVLVPEAGPGVRATLLLTEWLEVVGSGWARASARPSISFEGYQPVVEASWLSAEASLGVGGVF